MFRLLFLLLIPFLSAGQKALSAEEIITANLRTEDSKIFRMYETRKNAASVIVYLLPDCPACENYASTLNRLSDKYQSAGIRFYGVFPPFVKKHEIEKYRSIYKIRFPLLLDDNSELMKSLDAQIAPEAFIISESTVLLYRGRIDDWFYAVGRKKTIILHHELEDALSSIAAGKKVAVSKTQAIGCIIN